MTLCAAMGNAARHMHIAFVNNTEKWGGVKTWTLSMGASFAGAGLNASVYGQDPVFIAKAERAGLNAYMRPKIPDYSLFEIVYYRRMFRQTGADVVVVNVGKDLRTAGVAARTLGLPVIRRVGAPKDFRESFQTRLDHKWVRPAFICCSRYTQNRLIRFVPHVASYEHVAIHPGTHIPEDLEFAVRKPLRLVTTSRLAADKRHLDLLGALLVLRGKKLFPDLDIVGEGPMRFKLEEFVRENSLENQVRFHGFSTDVETFLRSADIFILPSLHEPLGIALEEAMAHGLVPVARNEGGVPEIWPDDLRELMLDRDAGPEEFAAVLENVLSWTEERHLDVRRAVKDSAAAKFSQEGQFAVFHDWVQKIMRQHAEQLAAAAR